MIDKAAVTSAFTELAKAYLDDHAERHPDLATEQGDHRFDAHLPDRSAAALAAERPALDGWAARLSALDAQMLSAEDQVDAAIMANDVARRIFEIDELREHTWNPLPANPGRAIYRLLSLEFAPLPDRLASVAGRLAEVPAMLAAARSQLGPMPRVHIETALGQFSGTIKLVTDAIDEALAAEPSHAARIGEVRPAALEALTAHRAWLSAQLSGDVFASPRIGMERFASKLTLTLQTGTDADSILARANADLERVTEEITALAASLGGDVRLVLGRLAADAPDDRSIRGLCREALTAQTAFVRDGRMVTVHDDPIEIIEMPEIDRGVAVAYCDWPGALETAPLPTFIGVSPTPADWTAARVTSFYREYNRHMVQNLMIHEAMPGHALQLQHSIRFDASSSAIRKALTSGAFIEGWAVYTEELMADHEYPGEGDPRTVRMQQLKMQLRSTINAILDAGVHARGMTEAEAMALMMERGYQEEGEAAGKWRRAQLTSAQLSTYYVGYSEIADLARALKAARPNATEQQIHDAMLAHGSPPVRLLRTLLLP
ncbi:MAG TPA: DUF885 domain-containing protein [Streptosporangiaceae bacterium]